MVAIDSNTCVLVGVGQSIDRELRGGGEQDLVRLMVGALDAASHDAGPGRRLLDRLDSLRVVRSFGPSPDNTPRVLADELGLEPPELVLSTHGGTMPQKMLADAAQAIERGTLSCVAIVGGECMAGTSAGVPQSDNAEGDRDRTISFGPQKRPLTSYELDRGLRLPAFIYPLLENAYRANKGRSVHEHSTALGNLWARFAAVAPSNPYAWIQSAPDARSILESTENNRMIAEPYTKTMVANLPVNLSAAIIAMRLGDALAMGISRDAMVFFCGHAQADDHWFISDRENLGSSPALREAGSALFSHLALDADDLALIDLYSCFPVAVELAAEALNLDVDNPDRPLTVTGGLTFAGGPGNSYVLHSLATMVASLRQRPHDRGLVTGLSYFATSHSIGIYSATSPQQSFASLDAQAAVDRKATKVVDPTFTGAGSVETYTVVHSRETGAKSVIAAVVTPAGARTWAWNKDSDFARAVSGADLLGVTCQVQLDGSFTLS